jgi:ABC-type transporter Mla subunit MlaD
MTHFREFAGGLAIAIACLLLYDLDQTVVDVRCQIPMAVEKLDFAAAGYNARGVEISNETLDLIGSSQQLVGNLNKAAVKLPTLVQNLSDTTAKLPALVSSGTDAVDAATTAEDTLNVQLAAIGKSAARSFDLVPPLIGAGTTAFNSFNTVVSDPATVGAVRNLNTTMFNVSGITGDVHDWTHRYVHPDPCPYGALRCHSVSAVNFIRGWVEPTYYGVSLMKGK